MNFIDFYSKHDKIALMLSGGKDSIACLHLIDKFLDRTVVIWTNTSANFKEIEEFMAEIKAKVPNFVEIKVNQPEFIEKFGYPADVLPMNYTPVGQLATGKKDLKLVSYLDCCNNNIWQPTALKIKELGITGIIRGQRSSETHKAPIKSGDVIEGIEYLLPIEDWSSEQVLDYLKSKDVNVNGRLSMDHSSLDCWNCTAYLADSKDRMNYVEKKYPNQHKEVIKVIGKIKEIIENELNSFKKILEH